MELATETKPNRSARSLPALPRPAQSGARGPHLLLTLAQRAALQASICDLRAGADAARDRALRHQRAAGDAVSRSVAEATQRVFVALGTLPAARPARDAVHACLRALAEAQQHAQDWARAAAWTRARNHAGRALAALFVVPDVSGHAWRQATALQNECLVPLARLLATTAAPSTEVA